MTLNQLTPLQQRLIVSSAGILIAFTCILLAPIPSFKPLFSLLIATVVGLAVREYYNIAKAKGLMPRERLGIALAVAYVFTVAISTQYPAFKNLPDAFLVFSLFCIFISYFSKGHFPFENSAVTFFAIFYLAVTLSCILRIIYFFDPHNEQDGRWWLLYMLTATKMTDTGGFFIGKKFGERPLAPFISPKKTWEGTIGGLCAAIFGGFIVYWLANMSHEGALKMTLWQCAGLSVILGVLAQCGDLAESLLKRDGGVKDSSHLPGLGGILDIVDSLVFTAPVVYIFLKLYAQQ
jgi:phosphatidate cytidylyltransferase